MKWPHYIYLNEKNLYTSIFLEIEYNIDNTWQDVICLICTAAT